MPTAAPELELIAPSFESVPASSWTLGPDAARLCASAGLVLDPWEALALDRILAEKDDRTPAAFEVGLIVPRQNGKGSVLEALSLAWLFLTDSPLILHSAHEFKTAAEAFRRLRTLIQGSPLLWGRVEKVTTAAGNEAIELVTGQRLRYVARSKASGRGFTGGKLILDEAYAIEAEEMAALLPTLATQPEAQLVYTSSAGMAESNHLRRVRDRGRVGGDPSLCYLEWGGVGSCLRDCKHDLDDAACALNDRGLWRGANPGIDIRIPEEFIEKERRALGPAEFARERLGWWDKPIGGADPDRIPADAWMACVDPASAPTGPVVFSVDMRPDGAACSIGVAGRRVDGLAHVGVVAYGRGTDWVAPRLLDLTTAHETACGVVWQPSAPIGALGSKFETAGLGMLPVTAVEMAQACGAFKVDVVNGSLRHQGTAVLDDAFTSAERRVGVEGAWTWGRRKSAGDISPLVAVTAALYGLALAGDGEPSVYVF